MQTMRIISWNISHQGNMGKKIALIKQLVSEAEISDRPCIVALQEVTGAAYSDIISENILGEC